VVDSLAYCRAVAAPTAAQAATAAGAVHPSAAAAAAHPGAPADERQGQARVLRAECPQAG